MQIKDAGSRHPAGAEDSGKSAAGALQTQTAQLGLLKPGLIILRSSSTQVSPKTHPTIPGGHRCHEENSRVGHSWVRGWREDWCSRQAGKASEEATCERGLERGVSVTGPDTGGREAGSRRSTAQPKGGGGLPRRRAIRKASR